MQQWRSFVILSSSLYIFLACADSVPPERTPTAHWKDSFYSASVSHQPILQTFTLKSLVPQYVQLPPDVTLVHTNLPRGSMYDASTHSLRWLPHQTQVGKHLLKVRQQEQDTVVVLDVDAHAEEVLNLGPPGQYKDSDVGYVYIHGMSMKNYCTDDDKGWNVWKWTADILSPDTNNRAAVCYDGRGRIDHQAADVARQIIDSPCGVFNKCIVVTHSMGGLMIEYILLHAKEGSKVTVWERELFRQAQEKTLFVLELGSASGGAELANVVKHPEQYPRHKHLMGQIGKLIPSQDAIDVLALDFATQEAAPLDEDPGVPIFMVPGYSRTILAREEEVDLGVKDVFNGRLDLAALDRSMALNARNDGLVTFRSSCGIASDDEKDGPGYHAPLEDQFSYCFLAPKKPRHHVWFTMNLHHFAIYSPFAKCQKDPSACQAHSLDAQGNIVEREDLRGMDSVTAIRHMLAAQPNSP